MLTAVLFFTSKEREFSKCLFVHNGRLVRFSCLLCEELCLSHMLGVDASFLLTDLEREGILHIPECHGSHWWWAMPCQQLMPAFQQTWGGSLALTQLCRPALNSRWLVLYKWGWTSRRPVKRRERGGKDRFCRYTAHDFAYPWLISPDSEAQSGPPNTYPTLEAFN